MKPPAFDPRKAPRDIHLIKSWLATGADIQLQSQGGSMAPTYRQGDVLTVRAVPQGELRADDIAVFVRGGILVAHRVVRVNGDGTVLTQGDSQSRPDAPVAVSDVIGKVIAHKRPRAVPGTRRVRALASRAWEELGNWTTASRDTLREPEAVPVPDAPKNPTSVQTFAIQHLGRELITRAARELRAAGIPFLVIKGMASAAVLYDDPLQRPYSDVDLLVRWRDVARAWTALGRAGWDRRLVSSHLFEARHPRVPAMQVDGQGHAGFPLIPRGGLKALLEDSETFVLRAHPNAEAFVALPTAGRDAMPAMLAMFVVRDIAAGWGPGTPGEDLPRAIDRASSPDAMWKRAAELGLDRALLAAIDSVCPERMPGGLEPWWLASWRKASRAAPSVRTVGQRRVRLLGTAWMVGGPASMGAMFTEMALTKALRVSADEVRRVLGLGR